MASNVLDYRGQEPKKFWASGLGHAIQFGVAFTAVSMIDIFLYTMWALHQFMDAPPNRPVPADAFVVLGAIGLMSFLGLGWAIRRPVRSWLAAGTFSALLALSVIQIVGLMVD